MQGLLIQKTDRRAAKVQIHGVVVGDVIFRPGKKAGWSLLLNGADGEVRIEEATGNSLAAEIRRTLAHLYPDHRG